MSDTYKYPGVYIEEDATPGLSISSSATAVPVFAHDGSEVVSEKLERIDSWLDFLGMLRSTCCAAAASRNLHGTQRYLLKTT